MMTQEIFHSEQAKATVLIHTDYGTFCVCESCLHHIPHDVRTVKKGLAYTGGVGCQCEHMCHEVVMR